MITLQTTTGGHFLLYSIILCKVSLYVVLPNYLSDQQLSYSEGILVFSGENLWPFSDIVAKHYGILISTV